VTDLSREKHYCYITLFCMLYANMHWRTQSRNFDFVVEGVDGDITLRAANWNYLVQKACLLGSCEHGDKPFGCTKYWKFLNYLRKYWLLRKDSYPRCLSVHGKSTDWLYSRTKHWAERLRRRTEEDDWRWSDEETGYERDE